MGKDKEVEDSSSSSSDEDDDLSSDEEEEMSIDTSEIDRLEMQVCIYYIHSFLQRVIIISGKLN